METPGAVGLIRNIFMAILIKVRNGQHRMSGVARFFGDLAGGPGFEPGLTGPEPVVLPLDDPPI